MMSKLKMWEQYSSWDEAEKAWDNAALKASENYPIKKLSRLPEMPGMTAETAKNLKWKSLKWMILKDKGLKVFKGFLRHPFKYGLAFIRSSLAKKSFKRDGDFFLYGIESAEEFVDLIEEPNSILIAGFSYCHKPFECPSGRFTDQCVADINSSVCRQCFIGKCRHALPKEKVVCLLIPTIHYIGSKIFDIIETYPNKRVIFLITACEMTLEMFGDWGNMVALQGIGVRLDGRICNTMKAFELSERGIKPGLTVVLEPTQQRILDLIRIRREALF